MDMSMKKTMISEEVGNSLRAAKKHFDNFVTTLSGAFEGLKGTGIEAHAGATSLQDKANLFDGTAIVERFKEITDLFEDRNDPKENETDMDSMLKFIPSANKLNSFINSMAGQLSKMEGGSSILKNLQDALSSAKENIVDGLHTGITENQNEIENDGGFSAMTEAEQRMALELLLEQDEEQTRKMMEDLNSDDGQDNKLDIIGIYSKLSSAATFAKDSLMDMDNDKKNLSM